MRWLLLFAFFFALATYVALPYLSTRPGLHRWIEAKARGWTQLELRLGDMRIGYNLGVVVTELTLAGPGAEPFLTADRIDAAPHLPGFVRSARAEIHVTAVRLYVARLPAPREGSSGGHDALSGAKVAEWLFGQRIEVADAFVHFGSDDETIVGPLNLNVDSLAVGDGVQLNGSIALGSRGSRADFSAELGARLAASRASVRADIAFDELLGSYAQIVLPEPLQKLDATLSLDLIGTTSGKIALALNGALRQPGVGKPVPVSGSGEFDPAERALSMNLLGDVAEYSSADSSVVASGVRMKVELATKLTPGRASYADFVVNVPTGEMLWERYYVELGEHPLKVSGRVEASDGVMKLTRVLLAVGGIGTIRGSGTYEFALGRPQGRLEFDLPGIAALYRVAVRDPFVDARPVLAGITVEGRAIGHVEQRIDAQGSRRLTGVVELSGGTVNSVAPEMRLNGIDLRLPFDLADADVDVAPAQGGWLHLAGLSAGGVDFGRVRAPLTVTTNRVDLSEPVRLPMFGGSLDVTHLRVEDLMSARPSASAGLIVHELELQQATNAAGLARIEGRVTGAMPNLMLQDGSVQSEGEIRIEMFGGVARLRNLRIDELTSPVPALRLDLDFRDISLALLTRTFEVGRVSGIIAGEVDGLVVVDGQPVSFDARVATVPRAGVSQRISVRAIRQISILGGSGGDPFSQGILSFFDEYRYAKMGFRCRLENDRFRLHGVEEADGKEYLVVGAALPPRVSVVSHTRVIAFSELVQRLARITSIEERETE